MNHLQMPPTLPLAEVQTPTGAVWYIPYAQRHGDFIVQRRYRRIGETVYILDDEEKTFWENAGYCVAYLAPFLNPGAVRAAGLDLGSILNQMAQDPAQTLAHPTYGQLCLRWGENAGGYIVSERVPELLPDEGAIPFTPYTCWLTGTTYYRLDYTQQGGVFENLLLRAGLRAHEQEIGLEGNWCGWYITDLSAARQALAESGQYPVVTSAQNWYGLKVVEMPSGVAHWVRAYTTAEETLALYQQMPEFAAKATASSCALLQYGRATQWPGRMPEWQVLDDKEITSERASQLLLDKMYGKLAFQVLPNILSNGMLADADLPLMPRNMMLGARLDTVVCSRAELARRLKWPLDKLAQCEQNPEELTLIQVRQLAHELRMQEEALLHELRQEIRVRYANRELQKKYTAARVAIVGANQ